MMKEKNKMGKLTFGYTKGSNEGTSYECASVEIEMADQDTADMCRKLFQTSTATHAEKRESISQAAAEPAESDLVSRDVVAIYDDYGIPSIMHRFRKMTNKELFDGSDRTNGAFIIGGVEYDEIYIGVYEGCNINGRVYSLPYQKPWTSCTEDEFAKACFAKGDGWHMMTAIEYGLIANLSLKNGTLPHGNTDGGRYHENEDEHGEIYDGHFTLTGSGPATWTHDHTPYGVHDMCGNIWEMVRGLRLRGDFIQAAMDNDAALPETDLSFSGNGWHNVTDIAGDAAHIAIFDQRISICTCREPGYCPSNKRGNSSDRWANVDERFDGEGLKELAIYCGEPNAWFSADTSKDEHSASRGGDWAYGASAGVFHLHFNYSRSFSGAAFGGRPAYFKRKRHTRSANCEDMQY